LKDNLEAPIQTEASYQKALGFICAGAIDLVVEVLRQELIPDTITVFTHSTEEYDILDNLLRNKGKVSRFTHGQTLYIESDETIAGYHITLLGVRKPDNTRPERGYADFPVDNYEELKTASIKNPHVKEITSGQGTALLELKHPDFDVRAYVVKEKDHE
jgi:hypothetical protein